MKGLFIIIRTPLAIFAILSFRARPIATVAVPITVIIEVISIPRVPKAQIIIRIFKTTLIIEPKNDFTVGSTLPFFIVFIISLVMYFANKKPTPIMIIEVISFGKKASIQSPAACSHLSS